MSGKFKIALGMFLGVVAYLALAVLGTGGVSAFFSEPARITLAVITFALTLAAVFTNGHIGSGKREDRSNRWVLIAFGLIGLSFAFLPAYSERKAIWLVDGGAARWLGVLLFAAGGVLRIWPVYALGRRFSGLVAIQPGHTLVTDGIYRDIRHPSYIGMLINALGWSLVFRSGVGVLLTALLIPPLLARIRAEERLLREEFGPQYESYRRRSWRLVPGIY